jgi:two-component system, chemotaxis family, chemotaxis protein CheY
MPGMKTILSVDDSASMRQMVAFTLESAGYRIVQAEDGEAALAKVAQARPDMVITDLNMPKLDGIGLIKRLRADPKMAGLPIVMLTTESEESKKQAGKAAGATGWIVKPFEQAKMIAVVQKLIG